MVGSKLVDGDDVEDVEDGVRPLLLVGRWLRRRLKMLMP